MLKQTNRFSAAVFVMTLLLAFTAAFIPLKAGAESAIDPAASAVEEYSEPVYEEPEIVTEAPEDTEYFEPETEAEYTEPETEYIAPETEQAQPETQQEEYTEQEYVEPETQATQNEYIAMVESAEEPTNFIAPQMDKSVSKKTYSTDYTAGIISWICVGVGVIVVIAVLISTKVSGRKAQQKYI